MPILDIFNFQAQLASSSKSKASRSRPKQFHRRSKRKILKKSVVKENITVSTEPILEKAATNDNNSHVNGETERRFDCGDDVTHFFFQDHDGKRYFKYFEENEMKEFVARFRAFRLK